MKAESNIIPQHPFVVERRGTLADITFFENVTEGKREGQLIWGYDSYALTVPYRPGLDTLVAENLKVWMDAAKATEAGLSASLVLNNQELTEVVTDLVVKLNDKGLIP